MESRSEPAATPQPPPARIRPTGGLVERGGETWYRIAAHHRLRPFLMSLPTDTDLWMFVTSRGGLTAGRVDPDGSLFPYLTSDRLHDAHHHTGPLTLVRAETDAGEVCVWEPFAAANDENPAIERNLDKHVLGNALVFEEIDHALGLAFRYEWAGCDAFGWVRRATLENRGDAPVRLAVLDGLRNLMPWGVPLALDQQASNLADAYKKTEVDPETGLGIVALTAGITDRAEAREVLRATTVWNRGLPDARVHLSLDAVADFRAGRVLAADTVRNGGRGHYLVSSHLALKPGAAATWVLAADTGRDHVQVAALRRRLRDGGYLRADVDAELRRSRRALRGLIASADGLQRTGRDEAWSHHLANVLYNILRGGVFWRNHDIPRDDLADVLATRNRPVAERHRERIAAWPDAIDVDTLQADVRESGDPDLRRLALESLPLHFGRRHGDPSRPWNRFAIRVRDRDGDRVLHHQGNWRDIFQNWEALAPLPGLPAGHGGPVRERLDRRRLQPLPYLARRHRLGGARTRRPLEQHRLLGRPPGDLPAEAARVAAPARPARARRHAGRRRLQLRRRALHAGPTRRSWPTPPRPSSTTRSVPRASPVARPPAAPTAAWSPTTTARCCTSPCSRSCWCRPSRSSRTWCPVAASG